mmetsp:Transcript_4640/g.10272  ORF Transcript_4640/g.10272 Transcript_4640/m.10272 type:complete len:333 (-) Transcript_4640:2-1000(-)
MPMKASNILESAINLQSLTSKPSKLRFATYAIGFILIWTALSTFVFVEVKHRDLHEDEQQLRKSPSRSAVRVAKNELWIETIRSEPRIFIIHNLISQAECEHLISLAKEKGLQAALITPYGTHTLVESSTRTNKQAWLDYAQDRVVSRIEKTLADITRTTPEHGENLQILHYNRTQEFQKHHDYFDPATDPPENFEKGGNRLATAVIYLRAAEEGGETSFVRLGLRVTARPGDAVLFYNLRHKCDGTRPECVDKLTEHAGMPPSAGEKWVATKWIHERPYQTAPDPPTPGGSGCKDEHDRCSEWAQRRPSECVANPVWMGRHCRFSCLKCNA